MVPNSSIHHNEVHFLTWKENWYFNHHYTFLTLFPTLLVLYLSLPSNQQYNKLHEVERVEAKIGVGWVGNTVVEKDKKYKSQWGLWFSAWFQSLNVGQVSFTLFHKLYLVWLSGLLSQLGCGNHLLNFMLNEVRVLKPTDVISWII
jgi:hypothetical protein